MENGKCKLPLSESSSKDLKSIIGLFKSLRLVACWVDVAVVVVVVVVDVVVVDVVFEDVGVVVVVGLGVVIGILTGVVDDVITSDPVTRIGLRLEPPTLADDAEMENMFFAS